ncbi:MAG: hypothetical protein U0990_09370 [Candidatus Nanopelagicales bacterium]|nr:hypothetical protein [Candidatus Nanopelagicales bacterium]
MSIDIQKLDIGTVVRITAEKLDGTAHDISAATLTMEFLLPDGTTVIKAAVLDGTGTDGKLKYVGEAAFFSQVGKWEVQAHVVWDAANDFRTLPAQFHVGRNLI